ncbi:CHAT domain-containing protein [Bailinhaonella thermotolerans]|uniref:CHAT domain-containing protein n=1 Tax=Bailinhaonella thermotolerans TaxID=1070861 RepID=A0A3A4B0M5_9ACTN|nr:CHAT domain-containing protein [Bailinhaonella thermotolerans]RJL34389.1 CHAT domain-containing protein [Bailinhaonella thermotolerans]
MSGGERWSGAGRGAGGDSGGEAGQALAWAERIVELGSVDPRAAWRAAEEVVARCLAAEPGLAAWCAPPFADLLEHGLLPHGPLDHGPTEHGPTDPEHGPERGTEHGAGAEPYPAGGTPGRPGTRAGGGNAGAAGPGGGVRAGRGWGEVLAVALRAAGVAARGAGAARVAESRLREAVRVGEEGGWPVRAAQGRLSLVPVLADLGELDAALAEAATAGARLTGVDSARLEVHRAGVLVRAGRHREAVARFGAAMGPLEAAGDHRFLAGALLNRATAHAYLGRYARAEDDLRRCLALAERAGLDYIALLVRMNLPFVVARGGDVPAALRHHETAERVLREHPERLATARMDLAEALLALRMPADARTLLRSALAGPLTAADSAEARLLLARAELLSGETLRARATAERAAGEFRAQRRLAWAPLADEVACRARHESGELTAALLAGVRRCARALTAAGHPGPAAHARIIAARVALGLGLPAEARAELEAVPPSAGPAYWHARALLRLLAGDRPAALGALRAGLRALAARAARLGAADLRAHALTEGADLADLGLSLALSTADPALVLSWSEHWRALTSPLPPTSREEDGPARSAGEPGRGTPARPGGTAPGVPGVPARPGTGGGEHAGGDAGHGDAPAGSLGEGRVRWRYWARATGGAVVDEVGVEAVLPGLGGAVLVELVREGDRLAAVVAGREGWALRDLGSYTEAAEAGARLRFGLRRLAYRDSEDVAAAGRGVVDEAFALDERVFGPLRDLTAGRDTVIAPVGALYSAPWGMLPSLAGTAVTVVASVTRWLGGRERPGPGGGVVAVAGPGLRLAGPEAEAVAALRAGRVLAGPAATRDAVLRAVDGAGVAHFAAHGSFRGDSPLFSRLELADGGLMAYELMGVRRAPRLVVLSSCDGGLAGVPADGAPLGTAGMWLGLGTANVVASVVPVRDEDAMDLMTLFHGLLADGLPPAAALARAEAKTGVHGFVCFGGRRTG